MPHIEQLSPHIANLIAAGEVVERPASVVKELLENAIDAGARNVTVELQNGGLTYLRVTDDGCGIAPDELPTAFLRHATSKLRTAADLAAIGTLGFRGEALAAIASVSHLDIFSRQTDAASGATLHLDGGKPLSVEPAGCPEGTSIIVRDLFYNTPARLKFMKQDRAEATAIAGLAAHIALSHPDISFRLIKDGREELHTPGDGKPLSAVYAALGRDFALALVEVHGRDGQLAVDGFVTKPLAGRGTRGMQTFFVNGRFIKSQLLTAAVEEAYANRLMKGKFPGCVLNVTLPADMVDVNVHPAKKEVRFRRAADVVNTLVEAIANTLQRHARQETRPAAPAPDEQPSAPSPAPAAAGNGTAATASPLSPSLGPTSKIPVFPSPAERPQGTSGPSPVLPVRPISLKQVPATQGRLDFPEKACSRPDAAPGTEGRVEKDLSADFKYLGTLHQQFALFETPEGLVLMHPKAARERIIFERLRAHRQAPMPSQHLLDPVMLDLDPRDFAVIQQFAPHFDQAGLTVTPFGQNTIRIESIPALLELDNAKAFLLELVDRLTQSEFSRNAKRMAYETFIAEIARKSAWKERISPHRAPAILKELLACEVPYCTPAGKPTLVNYSIPEIKRKFGMQA